MSSVSESSLPPPRIHPLPPESPLARVQTHTGLIGGGSAMKNGGESDGLIRMAERKLSQLFPTRIPEAIPEVPRGTVQGF